MQLLPHVVSSLCLHLFLENFLRRHRNVTVIPILILKVLFPKDLSSSVTGYLRGIFIGRMLSTIRRLSVKRSIPCRRLAADSKSPIDIPGPPPNKLFQVIRVIGAAGINHYILVLFHRIFLY